MAVVYALVQLVGNYADDSDVLLEIVLWALVALPLALLAVALIAAPSDE